MLGQHARTEATAMVFPLMYRERFRFIKTFPCCSNLQQLAQDLQDDDVILELVHENFMCGTLSILASYETRVHNFLFPLPGLKPCYSCSENEAILKNTNKFPGSLGPKVEFTTVTVVKETCRPEFDCLKDKACKLVKRVVTCPGVRLPLEHDVFLSVCMLGQHIHTRSIAPIFPLVFKEKFKFVKTFPCCSDFYQLDQALRDESVVLELVRDDRICGRMIVLAIYETCAQDFLFPQPGMKSCYSCSDSEACMNPTNDFPAYSLAHTTLDSAEKFCLYELGKGCCGPKVEFSPMTTIKETCRPELDCLKDKVCKLDNCCGVACPSPRYPCLSPYPPICPSPRTPPCVPRCPTPCSPCSPCPPMPLSAPTRIPSMPCPPVLLPCTRPCSPCSSTCLLPFPSPCSTCQRPCPSPCPKPCPPSCPRPCSSPRPSRSPSPPSIPRPCPSPCPPSIPCPCPSPCPPSCPLPCPSPCPPTIPSPCTSPRTSPCTSPFPPSPCPPSCTSPCPMPCKLPCTLPCLRPSPCRPNPSPSGPCSPADSPCTRRCRPPERYICSGCCSPPPCSPSPCPRPCPPKCVSPSSPCSPCSLPCIQPCPQPCSPCPPPVCPRPCPTPCRSPCDPCDPCGLRDPCSPLCNTRCTSCCPRPCPRPCTPPCPSPCLPRCRSPCDPCDPGDPCSLLCKSRCKPFCPRPCPRPCPSPPLCCPSECCSDDDDSDNDCYVCPSILRHRSCLTGCSSLGCGQCDCCGPCRCISPRKRYLHVDEPFSRYSSC